MPKLVVIFLVVFGRARAHSTPIGSKTTYVGEGFIIRHIGQMSMLNILDLFQLFTRLCYPKGWTRKKNVLEKVKPSNSEMESTSNIAGTIFFVSES